MSPELNDLIKWAREAGGLLRERFGGNHTIRFKGSTDIVTEADHQSEALLMERILSRFPTHTIITEESGYLNGNDDHCWYLDPIDGTINFAHGFAFFCVSIAYAEAGSLKLGVVYDPIHEELFSAELGQGAYLNGKPIHPGNATELHECLLVSGLPHHDHSPHTDAAFACFRDLTLRSQGVRRLGSAALDLCYTACGRLDGYWELSVQHYDIAASALIAREAGCIVTKVNGDDDILKPPVSILAGNAQVYALLRETVQRHGL
ncbi:MAG: inositol monophosphatase family protein [Chloroflexota bacterium]